jgi:hypothetical protein
VQPDTETCADSGGSGCIFGTVQQADGFVVGPTRVTARLYREFPSGSASVIAQQIVARDLTWAFQGLAAWGHYYVQFEPGFPVGSGVSVGALTRIGPLVLSATAGAPVAVSVKPVQIDVFEQSATGGPLQVQTASAHLVEMGAGAATVSLLLGTTATPMPWTTLKDAVSTYSAYYAQFVTPPGAQPTYQVTTSQPGLAAANWTLVADPPSFTGTIKSPSAGATVPAGQDLTVTWALQPGADYEEIELFEDQQGSWSNVFASPRPDPADVSQETIPRSSIAQPGTYLLNVAFTKANCPPTADGCVHASAVANEQIIVE